jgi:ASC-1-like (ASCH) protein
MPLFMVRREVFEWIKRGLKTVELRKGRPKAGEEAVFQCDRNIIRVQITEKREGSRQSILETIPYGEIIPTARSVEEAAYIGELYGTTDGIFTAYRFRT